MRLVADENIPFVAQAFVGFGTVEAVPARQLTPDLVRDADVLLVRSVTPVNAALLDGSRVRFVGTATIGTDHLDLPYLAGRGIAVASAPGSNAESVVEWVIAALVMISSRREGVDGTRVRREPLAGKTMGVVGVGNVGGRLAPRLEALGITVLRCDPPRAEAEGPAGFVALDEVLETSDIVTLHTPLVKDGPHPTHHLIGDDELARMRPGAWLVNASRGAVANNRALVESLRSTHTGAALLDVFEGEPVPDADLMRLATLVTPHIAGYSVDGKLNGARMLYDALSARSGADPGYDWADAYALAPEDRRALGEATTVREAVAALYDIEADGARLRATLDLAEADRADAFARLRKTYPRRRAWTHYRDALPPDIAAALVPTKA